MPLGLAVERERDLTRRFLGQHEGLANVKAPYVYTVVSLLNVVCLQTRYKPDNAILTATGSFSLANQKHGDEAALKEAVLQAVNTPIDRFIRKSICRLLNRVMSRTLAHPEPPYAAPTMTTRANDARHRTLSDIDWRAVAASKPLPADLAVSPHFAPGAFFGFPLLYLQALIDGPQSRLFDIRIALCDLIASSC